jgi:hypothetical protein
MLSLSVERLAFSPIGKTPSFSSSANLITFIQGMPLPHSFFVCLERVILAAPPARRLKMPTNAPLKTALSVV